eukprot:2690125-Heterocapsa_arctica.AAC.1
MEEPANTRSRRWAAAGWWGRIPDATARARPRADEHRLRHCAPRRQRDALRIRVRPPPEVKPPIHPDLHSTPPLLPEHEPALMKVAQLEADSDAHARPM